VDRLKRLREPATVIALVGLALHLVLAVVYLLVAPTSDDLLLVELAVGLGNPLLVALPAVLAATCWLAEATPRARTLTMLGLLLTCVLLAFGSGLLIAGVVRTPADARIGLLAVLLRGIPGLTVAVLALGLFIALLQRPSVAPAPVMVAELEQVEPPAPVPAAPADPQLQPGWSSDAAVGAVWRRAGDAAAGAPATSWDATANATGWSPIPTPERPSQPPVDQP
jgi:hypothetical protein